MIKILIDNGHGSDTLGKCSPNKLLREYAWAREIAAEIVAELRKYGHDASLLTPEVQDVPLKTRCDRVDDLCKQKGSKNVLLVSIHANAAGSDGQWHNAGGWCAFTSKGTTEADKVAECLYDMANLYLHDYAGRMEQLKKVGCYSDKQRPIRTDKADGDSDLEENFYILRNTHCPAVLTENLFMDNIEDYNYMLSAYGKASIVNLHVDGIIRYFEQHYK